MTQPGDRRPSARTASAPASRRPDGLAERLRPRTTAMALVEAMAVALLAALAWALLKGILELSVGLLAIAAFGGWAIGAALSRVRRGPVLAALIAALAWLAGLVLTWVVTRIIHGVDFSAISFLSYAQQLFGLVEIIGLGIFVAAALYGARPRR